MLVYYNERYFPSGFLSAELREAYYRDMREHGMNSVTVYNSPDVDGAQVDFNHDYAWDISKETLEKMNEGLYEK